MDKLRLPDTRRVFASIHPNVLLTTEVTPIKRLLVCSADEGEGAITVAVWLPLAAAEQQTEPFLLMDGNFRQPGGVAAFGQKDLYGQGEIMTGETRSPVVTAAWSKLSAMVATKSSWCSAAEPFLFPIWIYKKL